MASASPRRGEEEFFRPVLGSACPFDNGVFGCRESESLKARVTPEGDLIAVCLRGGLGSDATANATPDGDLMNFFLTGMARVGSFGGVKEPGVSSPKVDIADGSFKVTRSMAGVVTRPGLISPFLNRPSLTKPYSIALPILAIPKSP